MTNINRVDHVMMWSNENIAQLNAELREHLEIDQKNFQAALDWQKKHPIKSFFFGSSFDDCADWINDCHIKLILKDINFFEKILAEAEYNQYHSQIWMNLSEPRNFYIWFGQRLNKGVRDAM